MKRFNFKKFRGALIGCALAALSAASFGCANGNMYESGLKGDAEGGGYHPDGFSSPNQHGYAFFDSTSSCAVCHGAELDGGSAGVSCDACPGGASWRADCTFCHGGTDNQTGAPPKGARGQTAKTDKAVGAHGKHVTEGAFHSAFDCSNCHRTPMTYKDAGHINGKAEIKFSQLAGSSAAYDADDAKCNSTYCHGNGRTPGAAVAWTSETGTTCGSCHGDKDGADKLSARHKSHIEGGVTCDKCHNGEIDSNNAFTDKTKHINGAKEVKFAEGSWDAASKTCSSTVCHSGDMKWEGKIHEAGYAAKEKHGHDFITPGSACKTCHGADLTGGSSKVSCDKCHTGGAGWRNNCTFCHGGKDDQTGAPPYGARGETDSTNKKVGAHGKHVNESESHSAIACEACHVKPATIDDAEHISGKGEVAFHGVSGANAVYKNDSATCSSVYCHGDGRSVSGDVLWTSQAAAACNSCHGDAASAQTLSGRHATHIGRGAKCASCHSAAVDADGKIIDKTLHVNGAKDINMTGGGQFDADAKTCSSTVCHADTRGWLAPGYHPEGWSSPAQHGWKFHEDASKCAACHGANLDGGTSQIGCDSCHTGGAGWRNNCTFCHGGKDDSTGAPPFGVRNEADSANQKVGAHFKHANKTATHEAYDCSQCHDKPTDIFSAGHITANSRHAQVKMSGVAGAGAAYSDADAKCSSVYCHGNGKPGATGGASWTDASASTCASCHKDATDPSEMSGAHEFHLLLGKVCADCHADTAGSDGKITGLAKHVNGAVEVKMADGTWDATGKTCSNATGCHVDTRDWNADKYHADGWNAPKTHGWAFFGDPDNCKVCHGANLGGGASKVSCDSCHTGGAGWRTNCVFCHGGKDNSTGAPPFGARDESEETDQKVGKHTKHVTTTAMHDAYDCSLCHAKPTDVFTSGHITKGSQHAQVAFGGVAAGGVYDVSSASCSSVYCHGNGLAGGTLNVVWTAASAATCDSCHPLASRNGAHEAHSGYKCNRCHSLTADANGNISDKTKHINGEKDVKLTSGTYNASNNSCSNVGCHGTRNWFGGKK